MKIIECKPIMDNKAHSVKFDTGISATSWNDKVNAGELMQAYASQAEIEVELKPYVSKAGKAGMNLVSFKFVNPAEKIETIVVNDVKPMPRVTLLSEKDISIISQCVMKCACYGRNDITVNDALGIYNEAKLALEHDE